MKHALQIFAALTTTWGQAAIAQDSQPTAGDIASFCAFASPVGDADYRTKRSAHIQQDFNVTVKGSVLTLKYDVPTESMRITVPQQLKLPASTVLDFGEASDFILPMERLRAETLLSQQQLGLIDLELTTVASAIRDESQAYCQTAGEDQTVHVVLITITLKNEDGERIATLDTKFGTDIKLRRRLGWPCYLGDSSPVVELKDGRRNSKDGSSLPSEQKAKLTKQLNVCYLQGLQTNARLQGALVVEWLDGSPGAHVVVDSMRNESVSRCVTQTLSSFASGRQPSATNGAWRMTIFMKLTSTSRL